MWLYVPMPYGWGWVFYPSVRAAYGPLEQLFAPPSEIERLRPGTSPKVDLSEDSVQKIIKGVVSAIPPPKKRRK